MYGCPIHIAEDVAAWMVCPEGAPVPAICAFASVGASDRGECNAHLRVYNHLLLALLQEILAGAMVPVHDNIRKAGLDPNVNTYSLRIKAMYQNDRVEIARKMLIDKMARKGCHSNKVSHSP